MMTKKFKEEIEAEALVQVKQRKRESAQGQQREISLRDSPPFVSITRKITDSEKRLISFISKALGAHAFLGPISDTFIL